MNARGQLPQSGGVTGENQPAVTTSRTALPTITREDYLRIHPKLAAKIRRFGIPELHVEDLLQETFQQAHEGLLGRRFGNRSALDTWVISIGKNLCLKHYRSRNAAKRKASEVPIDQPVRDPAAPPEPPLRSDLPSPARLAEDRELLARVVALIRALPAILREPLVLKARGHNYQQIAHILDIPPNLVSSRIHQARTELHRRITNPKTRTAR